MKRSEARAIRKALNELIHGYGMTSEAAFNARAATINEYAPIFPLWKEDADYDRGDVTIDPADSVPYWAVHAHGKTSGQIHQPSKSSTVWMHCHGTTPETARPFAAEAPNPYHTGHYCTENGGTYRCKQDNVVHAPSVLPGAWEVVS